MSTLLRAPRVRLTWTAGSLTVYFYAYRVYRRPTRMPVQPWQLIAELGIPSGYTATTVEAQHTAFDDYMAGWSVTDGEFAGGWDYVVTQVDVTGAEALITATSVTARGTTVVYPGNPWVTCNSLPFLNCPVDILQGESNDLAPRMAVRNYAGRDHNVVVTGREQPGRVLSAGAQFFGPTGSYQVNPLRMVSKYGGEVALLKRLGERVVGSVAVTNFAPIRAAREGVSFTMYETDDSTVAQYNRPAGYILNGSSQYLTTPDAAHLDPASSAFSVVMAAQFSSTASKYALSKGNLGTADGYGLRTTANANELQFFVDGASAAGGPVATSADWFSDVSVAVGTSSGTAQTLYRNGVSVGTSSVTHGAVANDRALVAGANNGVPGTPAAFSALAPLRGYAVYMRELSAAEALAASYYLLGYPGYRMPAGAVLFVDLRDDRSTNGIRTNITDLSDYGNTVTATGSPTFRGIPWPLSRYETL